MSEITLTTSARFACRFKRTFFEKMRSLGRRSSPHNPCRMLNNLMRGIQRQSHENALPENNVL